jgi:hypothetical protein
MNRLGTPNCLLCVGRLIQHISSPFIEAFSTDFGCRGDSDVNAGWYAQGQLARVGFIRLISQLGACGKIMVNRLFESCFQFVNGLAVEGDNILNTRQAAKENSILGVKLNAGGIAFLIHSVLQNVTPIFSRNSRAARTWYRNDGTFCHHVKVFSLSWGKWGRTAVDA